MLSLPPPPPGGGGGERGGGADFSPLTFHQTESYTDSPTEATMNKILEVRVPDIGDFKDVPVIEVLVKPGEAVSKEASLVTLESDKATMEVPSPAAGGGGGGKGKGRRQGAVARHARIGQGDDGNSVA